MLLMWGVPHCETHFNWMQNIKQRKKIIQLNVINYVFLEHFENSLYPSIDMKINY